VLVAPGPVYTKPEIEKETKKQLARPIKSCNTKRAGEIAVRKTLRKMIIVPGTLAKLISMVRVFPKEFITAI
jgi:hypothetical protein